MAMRPIAKSLEHLTVSEINEHTNMYNFIGSQILKNLRNLAMREMPSYRIITQHSFTRTPIIEYLWLRGCGVETIMFGSFDHIKHTLAVLYLKENKLKTLPADLIDGKHLDGYDVWICDYYLGHAYECFGIYLDDLCELFEVGALKNECASWKLPLQGEPIKSRKCFNHFGTNTFRINFTIDCALTISHDNVLYVKCARRSAYYTLITPDGHQLPLCLSTTAKYAAFSIEKFLLPDGVFVVSIMDPIAVGNVWPFHIILMTIQTSNEWISIRGKALFLTTSVIMYATAFILFTLVGIYIVARYNNVGTQCF